MDALEFLESQHADVDDLFAEYDDAETSEERGAIALRIVRELSLHTIVEEEIFYPAVRAALPDLADDILEDLEEHHLVKILLDEIAALEPNHERFDAKMEVLSELVDHHVDEEEEDLFPEVEDGLDEDELIRLGEQMARRRDELLADVDHDSG